MTETLRPIESKILPPEETTRWADEERAADHDIVWTNGCFDLLHRGHVRYLEAARQMGDLLIVGLNDDDSVRRLKGEERPMIPLGQRLEIIAALEAVDVVTWFTDDTPLALIASVRPKVIVKGGDYKPDEVVGAAEALAWGGRVEIVPFFEGHSTTDLLATIRNKG